MAMIDPVPGQPVACPSLLSSTEPSKNVKFALDRRAGPDGFPVATLLRARSTGSSLARRHKRYQVPELGGHQAPLTAGNQSLEAQSYP